MASPSLQLTKPNYITPRVISPLKVSIDASALLEVVETIYYDNSADKDAKTTRLIGTLLGTRSNDGNVIIKHAYIVPHNEKDGELIFEESHHFSTYQLYRRSNLDLQVVGWFSTKDELDLNTGLLHEFYSKSSAHPQILLTLQHKNEKGEVVSPVIKTYVSGPIGLPASSSLANSIGVDKSGAFAFLKIDNEVTYSQNELTSLKFINNAARDESLVTSVSSSTEFSQLNNSLLKIESMISTLQEYASKAASGEIKGDEKVGQILLSALKFQLSNVDIEKLKAQLDEHSNDTLLVEYLTSCIQQQLELSVKFTNFVLPEDALKQGA